MNTFEYMTPRTILSVSVSFSLSFFLSFSLSLSLSPPPSLSLSLSIRVCVCVCIIHTHTGGVKDIRAIQRHMGPHEQLARRTRRRSGTFSKVSIQ